MRKIATHFSSDKSREAIIYRDSEFAEYKVAFYLDGDKQSEADYFTDSRLDAEDTAKYFCQQ